MWKMHRKPATKARGPAVTIARAAVLALGVIGVAGIALCGWILYATRFVPARSPASFLLWYFVFLVGAAAVAGKRRSANFRRSWPIMVLMASMLALLASLVVTIAAHRERSVWLALMLVEGAAIGIVIAVARTSREPLATLIAVEAGAWKRDSEWFLVPLGVMLFGTVLTLAFYGNPRDRCGALGDALGPLPTGPLQATIYTDYECEPCAATSDSLRLLAADRSLTLVERQYPLDAACNPGVHRNYHAGACVKARAAICSARQSAGAYRDKLFSAPAEATALVALAAEAGLDRARFERCLTAGEADDELRRDIASGTAEHVDATPTLLLNDRRFVGAITPDALSCEFAERISP